MADSAVPPPERDPATPSVIRIAVTERTETDRRVGTFRRRREHEVHERTVHVEAEGTDAAIHSAAQAAAVAGAAPHLPRVAPVRAIETMRTGRNTGMTVRGGVVDDPDEIDAIRRRVWGTA